MSDASIASQSPAANSGLGGAPGRALGSTQSLPAEQLQQLIDQVAGFNVYAIPDLTLRSDNGGNGITNFSLRETLHRFDVVLQPPSPPGVKATNTLGEVVGQVDLRWFMIPDDFFALPGRLPPPVQLDPTVSQRFSMQEMTFSFGNGSDGFKSFGTGRTFPMMVGNQPRVVVGAIANITEGFGKLRGHEGNFTICGDLSPDGFRGNILVRIVDFAGDLRAPELPLLQPQPDPDPQTTFLMWGAQKGKGPDQENYFSFGPDGQPRGMNIPTQLKLLQLDFAAPGCFEGKTFSIGEIIGREIGYGRGSIPGASQVGTPLSPFLFDGVARYSFFDASGKTVGAINTNVVEGRRFDMTLPGDPNAPALRFGFFGPIIGGTGCFAGVQGMFYGSSGSVFYPPPGDHVVTHFYMARVNDPNGTFRTAAASGGWL